ncbi:C-type lectin lectoxin-Thr1-like [Protobothrops mucrosquamatus]|uniref:C-type lectin lectoxin-Thr1-like n=1 Tax=Protobothrops mucrosquamatus TaxID=103944 RepID=UPI0010FB3E3D|nr:C-type lectin lectoxin-Thr1-like [Protobothrops mucrosquamatus]
MGRFSFVSLGLLVVVISISGVKGCANGWLSMNGFCYKVNGEAKSWPDAEAFCRQFDSCCDLASIHSVEESDELGQYVSENLKTGSNVWIGLYDAQKNRVWEWTDRSCSNYLAWAPGEPNNAKGNEYCGELVPKAVQKLVQIAQIAEISALHPIA